MSGERLLDFCADPYVAPGKILSLPQRFFPFAVETFTPCPDGSRRGDPVWPSRERAPALGLLFPHRAKKTRMKCRLRASPRATLLAFFLASAAAHPEAPRFNPLADGILLGGGMALAGGSELLFRLAPPAHPPAPQIADVNGFDRAMLIPYSGGIDWTSTLTQYAVLALPVFSLFLGDVEDGMGAIMVAAEAYSLAYGAKNLLKYFLPRWRPYRYTGGASGVAAEEDAVSFPSGHATMAFAAAAINTYLFAELLPSSPWFIPFVGLNYALAAATAAMRVAAGMHFITDVAAGALLGTACGYAVPLFRAALLRRESGGKLSIAASADGVLLWLRL